jgi:hypothetical protein
VSLLRGVVGTVDCNVCTNTSLLALVYIRVLLAPMRWGVGVCPAGCVCVCVCVCVCGCACDGVGVYGCVGADSNVLRSVRRNPVCACVAAMDTHICDCGQSTHSDIHCCSHDMYSSMRSIFCVSRWVSACSNCNCCCVLAPWMFVCVKACLEGDCVGVCVSVCTNVCSN